MSEQRTRDDMIFEAFDRRARRATPIGLRGPILEATTSTRQHRSPWSIREGAASLRLLAVAVLVTAGLAAATIFVGSPLVAEKPTTAPVAEEPSTAPVTEEPTTAAVADETANVATAGVTTTVEYFRSFEYKADSSIPLKSIDTRVNGRGALIAFTFAEDEPYPTAGFGIIAPEAKGVTVSSARGGQVHDCVADGYARVREDPALFLLDLRRKAGIGLGETERVMFDGRPAQFVAVDPAANQCEPADFHARNFIHGILQQPMRLTVPSRLIVTEVDGETMVIQVWAGTEAGLQEWLRTSAAFVDSIHFTGDALAP